MKWVAAVVMSLLARGTGEVTSLSADGARSLNVYRLQLP
jgi:hypothetical protein